MSLAACQHCGAPLVVGALGCDRCGRYLGGDDRSRGTGSGALQTQLGTAVREALLENRYRLVSPIAIGHTSVVWRAHDTSLDRPVAVKVLGSEQASSAAGVARFEERARRLAAVEHPAVIPVLALGTQSPAPFLVMPLLEGVTLAEHLHARGGQLEPAEVCAIVHALCDAFSVLHGESPRETGLWLRHVFIGSEGQVTLLDAGVNVAAAAPEADARAPELALGLPPTPMSDVYALASVAAELLTGRAPGQRKVRLSGVVPLLAPGLASALEQARAADPAQRPATPAQLAALLEPFMPVAPSAASEAVSGPTQPTLAAPASAASEAPTGPTAGLEGQVPDTDPALEAFAVHAPANTGRRPTLEQPTRTAATQPDPRPGGGKRGPVGGPEPLSRLEPLPPDAAPAPRPSSASRPRLPAGAREPSQPRAQALSTSLREPSQPKAHALSTSLREPSQPKAQALSTPLREPSQPKARPLPPSVREPSQPNARPLPVTVREPSQPNARPLPATVREPSQPNARSLGQAESALALGDGPVPETRLVAAGGFAEHVKQVGDARRPAWLWWVLVAAGLALTAGIAAVLAPSETVGPPPLEQLPREVVRLAPPAPPPEVPRAVMSALPDDLQQRKEVVSPPVHVELPRAPTLRRGPGVAPGKMTRQRTITVRPLALNLAEAEIVATFKNKPVAAMLEVDGVYKGVTPEILRIPAGEYALRLQYKGLPVNEIDTNFTGGQRIRLEVELQTLEGAAIVRKKIRPTDDHHR